MWRSYRSHCGYQPLRFSTRSLPFVDPRDARLAASPFAKLLRKAFAVPASSSNESDPVREKEPDVPIGNFEPRDEAYKDWIFTVPNIICMARMVGSLGMLALAYGDHRYGFVAAFVCLTLSDWIDGRLARWLRQRSDFGARLDSFADAMLYGALLLGSILLCDEDIQQEWAWISAALGAYFVSTIAGLIKYRRVPSYHTFAAKKSQSIVLLASVLLVLEISVWPMRLAAAAVFLTNLETTLLTIVLPKWQADVPSLWTVARRKSKYLRD